MERRDLCWVLAGHAVFATALRRHLHTLTAPTHFTGVAHPKSSCHPHLLGVRPFATRSDAPGAFCTLDQCGGEPSFVSRFPSMTTLSRRLVSRHSEPFSLQRGEKCGITIQAFQRLTHRHPRADCSQRIRSTRVRPTFESAHHAFNFGSFSHRPVHQGSRSQGLDWTDD